MGRSRYCQNSALNPVHEAVRAQLGVQRLADTHTMTERPSILTVRDSDFAPVQSMSGVYRGRFQVVPTRYAIEARLPLRPAPYTRGRLSARHRQRRLLLRHTRRRGARVRRDHDLRSDAQRFNVRIYLRTPNYLKPSRHRRCISVDWLSYRFHRQRVVAGLFSARLSCRVPCPRQPAEAPFSVDQHWLQAPNWCRPSHTSEPFERTLEIPDFPLRVEPRVPPAQ